MDDKLTMNIPSINKDTHFWMVRTKRGYFYNEFLGNNFIGLGWNNVTVSVISEHLSAEQEKELKNQIQDEFGDKRPGVALNKCIRFCFELKEGDIALIVDRHKVAFVRIGEYYESDDKKLTVELEKEVHFKIENLNKHGYECPYIKRRKISILKEITDEKLINPYIYNAIVVNRHSLSSLDEYGETILSNCFSAFIYDGKLTITFRVARQESISAIVLADFVSNAARILSEDRPENISVKTTLHSPGDIIFQVWDFVQAHAMSLIFLYLAVFGGKYGDYEFNSVLSSVKDIIDRDYEKEKRQLELDSLREDIYAKRLDNLKKERDLKERSFKQYGKPLVAAAKKLQIDNNQETIADISEFLEKTNRK